MDTSNLKLKEQVVKTNATRRVANIYRVLATVVVTMIICSMTVFAGDPGGEAVEAINNVGNIISTVVKAIGAILGVWGMVQVGLSFSQHDASQRAQGFLQVAGGIMIFFAPELFQAVSGYSFGG